MRKIVSILCSAVLLCGVASAERFDSGGLIIDPSTITAFDMFNTGRIELTMGTARSAAMAGAMTSLGADASSMVTRWSTPKSDSLYSLQPKMEKLYTVSKNKTRS